MPVVIGNLIREPLFIERDKLFDGIVKDCKKLENSDEISENVCKCMRSQVRGIEKLEDVSWRYGSGALIEKLREHVTEMIDEKCGEEGD